MQTVKAARFNAAERLERKQLVSVVALSVVSLYFVGLSVWQALYAANLSEPANRLITLVSIMSSIATMVLALIEAMNDYKMKAHFMQTCALQVNDLLQELRLMPAPDSAAVQDIRRRYNDVVRGCPFNHARIDYLMARPPARWSKRLTSGCAMPPASTACTPSAWPGRHCCSCCSTERLARSPADGHCSSRHRSPGAARGSRCKAKWC